LIITLKDLSKIKDRDIVICAGWFDMFHVGHLRFLNKANAEANRLLIVVMNDADGKYVKGANRPLINQNDRAEIIDNLKCVDYTIISEDIKNNKPYPDELKSDEKSKLLWDRYIPIIEELQPSKVFALEETLKFNGIGTYIEGLGIKVIYADRTNGISTTMIEDKLKINK